MSGGRTRRARRTRATRTRRKHKRRSRTRMTRTRRREKDKEVSKVRALPVLEETANREKEIPIVYHFQPVSTPVPFASFFFMYFRTILKNTAVLPHFKYEI